MEYKIEKQSRGTRILYGEEVKERQVMLNKMISVVESYGFEGIILPSIEPQGLYTDKAGSEVLNQMYVFEDKKKRKLCLRPEATATVQQIAEHFWQGKKEIRVWYFEKCWRYERPQKGRYREFWQFGCEVINPKTKFIKEELIDIASELCKLKTNDILVDYSVKRGLDYYVEEGFEIRSKQLGAQEQICGGGSYKRGIGFAIGFDRLMLCK
jgi:histidyl-tRNA synthetase